MGITKRLGYMARIGTGIGWIPDNDDSISAKNRTEQSGCIFCAFFSYHSASAIGAYDGGYFPQVRRLRTDNKPQLCISIELLALRNKHLSFHYTVETPEMDHCNFCRHCIYFVGWTVERIQYHKAKYDQYH